jgi:hypothetical protein
VPHNSNAPHNGGASRIQLAGWMHDVNSLAAQTAQATSTPSLIALHIGEDEIARWAKGGGND